MILSGCATYLYCLLQLYLQKVELHKGGENLAASGSRVGRELRSVMIDLDRFARELSGKQSDQDRHSVTEENKRRPVMGIEEDPLIPWLRVAIMGLVFVALGIVIHLVWQLG